MEKKLLQHFIEKYGDAATQENFLSLQLYFSEQYQLTETPVGSFLPKLRSHADIAQKKQVTSQDFRLILDPTVENDQKAIAWLTQLITPNHLEYIEENYKLKLVELWELTERQQKKISLEEFIRNRRENDVGVWILDLVSAKLTHTLNKRDFYTVTFSRVFPLFSKKETQLLSKSKVLFSGLSTGSPVVQNLVGLGLGHVVGIDPDLVNLSNIRMGTGDSSVGLSKAVWLGKKILETNPFVELTLYPRVLEREELENEIKQVNLVCEMTDTFSNKVLLRQICREYEKTVCMGSGFGEQPSFIFENPQDPLFLRNLSQHDLEILVNPDSDPFIKAKKAIEVVAIEHLSLRALLNFILVSKLGYWSQLQTTASVVGGALGYSMALHLLGYEVTKEVDISLIDIFTAGEVQKTRNKQLFDELKNAKLYSAIFEPFNTLEEAVKKLCFEYFEIQEIPSSQ